MAEPESVTVGTLTGDQVIRVAPDAPLLEAARTIVANDIGLVAVGSADKVVGVVSERDIVRALVAGKDLEATSVAEVASTDLVWADASATVQSVAAEMLDHWVRHVLVESDGRLVGVVSARDLLGPYATASD